VKLAKQIILISFAVAINFAVALFALLSKTSTQQAHSIA